MFCVGFLPAAWHNLRFLLCPYFFPFSITDKSLCWTPEFSSAAFLKPLELALKNRFLIRSTVPTSPGTLTGQPPAEPGAQLLIQHEAWPWDCSHTRSHRAVSIPSCNSLLHSLPWDQSEQHGTPSFLRPLFLLFFYYSSYDSTLDTPVFVEDFQQKNDSSQVSGEPSGPDLSGDFEWGRWVRHSKLVRVCF